VTKSGLYPSGAVMYKSGSQPLNSHHLHIFKISHNNNNNNNNNNNDDNNNNNNNNNNKKKKKKKKKKAIVNFID
jgi:hypothetical protein